jgi:starch synthase (maltosyl-transferring)
MSRQPLCHRRGRRRPRRPAPELGTLEDFRALVAAAKEHGLELALDFAIQCSPDHPWLKEHPDWFDWRPDGTIRYAENPPKKYEDIVNVDFYAPARCPPCGWRCATSCCSG